jgi:hypothetical protein
MSKRISQCAEVCRVRRASAASDAFAWERRAAMVLSEGASAAEIAPDDFVLRRGLERLLERGDRVLEPSLPHEAKTALVQSGRPLGGRLRQRNCGREQDRRGDRSRSQLQRENRAGPSCVHGGPA